MASGDQFFVTHCTTADSVMNSPGYSVRAASAENPDVFKLALEYPPYELPLDMWRDKPGKSQAPRRLARTANPAGGIWVAHSVYLEKDTMNRDRSYFTHLLSLPASVDAAAVLESWDADGWVKEYAQGAPKNLPKAALPVGNKISRTTLTAFLTRSMAGPTELGNVVCPSRFRAEPAVRKQLVGQFLKAMLLVTQARAAGDARDRVFVHAEPGLVAILLYAATRILPPAFTADLGFSTFEPAHRAIRDYKAATVIGTYLGLPGKGLDQDLITTRGFTLDTLHPEKSSPELAEGQPLPPGLAELIELAAAGEWELLDDVHRLIGAETGAIDKVPGTIALARAVSRINRGGLTSADLIALKADRRGASILEQRSEKVWEFLKDAVLTDTALRAQFKDWITEPERLKAYRRVACEALVKGEYDTWDTRWDFLRSVTDAEEYKQQADRAQKNLDRYLPTVPVPARDRVRSICAASGAWPDHHLLAPTSLDELDSMLGTNVPAAWQGYTCFAVMGPDEKNWLLEATKPFRPAMRERVRHHLIGAKPDVLAAYLKHAKDYVSTMPGFLYDFLRPYRPESAAFLSRLIDAGASVIETADWVKLLAELDIYGEKTKEWSGFLLKNDHLAKLLAGFKKDPAATQVWDGYLNLLTPLLFEGDDWERIIYNQLSRARELLGAANVALRDVAPSGGARKLKGADTLLGLMLNPAAVDSMEPGQLLEAYQVFGIEPLEGLRRYYIRCNFHAADLNTYPQLIAPFATAFKACYPITQDYHTARTAIANWIGLSAACPDMTRGAFQAYFMRECIPVSWHQAILNEAPRIVLHPVAVAQVSQVLATLAKNLPAPSTDFLEESSPEEPSGDGGFDPAATPTRRARGGRAGGANSGGSSSDREGARPARMSVSRRKQTEGVPGWIYLVLVVGIIGIVGAIAFTQLKKQMNKTTEPEREPIKVVPKKVKDKDKDKDKDK